MKKKLFFCDNLKKYYYPSKHHYLEREKHIKILLLLLDKYANIIIFHLHLI